MAIEGPEGLVCPKCGAGTSVVESRPWHDTIKRRRECVARGCGHRYTTIELLAERDGGKLRVLLGEVQLHPSTLLDALKQHLASDGS